MKVYRLVRESAVQTILSPDDAARMLASGDWLIAMSKPKTPMAGRMRLLRNRRRAEGWTSMTLWMSAEDHAAITAAKTPGESVVELLVRLIKKQRLL